jgi:hypothetical protein
VQLLFKKKSINHEGVSNMKKILGALVLAICANSICAMDNEALQNRGTEPHDYTLIAVRNVDSVSVSFVSTKTFDVTSLTEVPKPIGESFQGVEIQKDEKGDLFLNITKDFSLPNQTSKFVLNFPEGNVRVSGNIQCGSLDIYCKNFYCNSGGVPNFIDVQGQLSISASGYIAIH